jgi:hypothetical protein
MDPRAILQEIKNATVAIAIYEPHSRKHPYKIIGTGFCIHTRGVVVSCAHVLSAFFERPIDDIVSDARSVNPDGETMPLDDLAMIIPHAIFLCNTDASRYLFMAPIRFEAGINMLDYDLSIGRIATHEAFPNGYPVVKIAQYDDLYEGMGIGTCGFPLGNSLADQLGTITSSFTKGILSSFIPAKSAQIRNVRGFQLDITATHGNSGGPVFMWEEGKVFAVLQGGPVDHKDQALAGLATAIPLWRVLENYALETILSVSFPSP